MFVYVCLQGQSVLVCSQQLHQLCCRICSLLSSGFYVPHTGSSYGQGGWLRYNSEPKLASVKNENPTLNRCYRRGRQTNVCEMYKKLKFPLSTRPGVGVYCFSSGRSHDAHSSTVGCVFLHYAHTAGTGHSGKATESTCNIVQRKLKVPYYATDFYQQ